MRSPAPTSLRPYRQPPPFPTPPHPPQKRTAPLAPPARKTHPPHRPPRALPSVPVRLPSTPALSHAAIPVPRTRSRSAYPPAHSIQPCPDVEALGCGYRLGQRVCRPSPLPLPTVFRTGKPSLFGFRDRMGRSHAAPFRPGWTVRFDVVGLGVAAKICTCCAFDGALYSGYSSTFRGRPFLGLGRWTGGSFGLGFMSLSELFASTLAFAFDLNGKSLTEVDRACGYFGCGLRSCCASKEYRTWLFGGVILGVDFARRMSMLICNEGKETCRYFTDALMDGVSQGRRQECYHSWVQPAPDLSRLHAS